MIGNRQKRKPILMILTVVPLWKGNSMCNLSMGTGIDVANI